jgi:hypothetical protein
VRRFINRAKIIRVVSAGSLFRERLVVGGCLPCVRQPRAASSRFKEAKLKIGNAASGIALAAALTAIAPLAVQAIEPIKSGEWQFTTHMQLPGMTQGAGDQGMTRTACINPANPIPADTGCNFGSVNRNGGVVSWTMTCSSPVGPIQSAGSARYFGETMQATLTAQIPGANGRPADAPGTITGRYLGPCNAK